MRRLGLLKLCNHVLFALALTSTLVGTAVSAAPVIEVESNDSIATAQSIDGFFDLAFDPLIEDVAGFNTSTTVPHAEVILYLGLDFDRSAVSVDPASADGRRIIF